MTDTVETSDAASTEEQVQFLLTFATIQMLAKVPEIADEEWDAMKAELE